MYSDSFENFIDDYNAGDSKSACGWLLDELGTIVYTKRSDFIHLLVSSGIKADSSMSDENLIELFVKNAPTNKNLCIGAAILINMENKRVGFDGDDKINDDAIKASYSVLQEEFSGIAGLLLAGAKLAGGVIQNKQAQAQAQAQDKMNAALIRKKQAAAKAKAEADKKKQTKKYLLIGGISLGAILVIGLIIYAVKNKK